MSTGSFHFNFLVSKSISSFVPADIIENVTAEALKGHTTTAYQSTIKRWIDAITLVWISLAGISNTEAKCNYLQQMRAWPYYSCSLFIVEVRIFINHILIDF